MTIDDPKTYTLEFVMSEDPTNLTKQDLAYIVQYHRNVRADRAAGTKKAKPTAAKPEAVRKMLKPKAAEVLDRRGL